MNIIKRRSPREMADVHAHRAPSGTLTGSYISDLASLGKAIMLCGSCQPKFNARGYGYATSSQIPECRGHCDGCKQFSVKARLYMRKG